MASLAETVSATVVSPGMVALFWLGNAGWIIKTPESNVIYIDPYLSNATERMNGYKRIMPSPISPQEIEADLIVTSHHHNDHLDPDTVAVLAAHPALRFAGPPSCVTLFAQLGVPSTNCTTLSLGDIMTLGRTTIRAVFADHGPAAPDAIGVVIETDGIRIYHTGDTAYRPEQMISAVGDVEILLPVINGKWGNMNALEAADLAKKMRPRIVIPHHYWMLAEAQTEPYGDPGSFVSACRERAPGVIPVLLAPGEPYVFKARHQMIEAMARTSQIIRGTE